MKKIYILTFVLLSMNSLIAQPNLQWIRPPYGTLKYYTMYQGVIPAPTEGANQNWNYATLNPSDIFALQYTDYNTLPVSAKNKFPTSTYVEAMPGVSLDITVINYYREYTDSLKRLGQQGSGGGLANTWGDIEAVFNIGYGDTTTSGTWFKYAGYGTLTTKFGTYNNVVALKRATTTFLYQTSPYFAPLMQIEYYNGNIVGSYIYHYTNASGIITQQTKATSIFPNPVNDQLTVYIPDFSKGIQYSLNDLNGKELLKGEIENPVICFHLSDLVPGMYLLKVGEKIFKIIKR